MGNKISVLWIVFLRRLWRSLALACHIVAGLVVSSCFFPFYSLEQQKQAIQRWSQRLLRIFGLQVISYGQIPASESFVLLSNHISWLDIGALHSRLFVRFIAKSEVGRWPLIGRLCRNTHTLFLDRARQRDAYRINADITAALQAGDNVGFFPEGTTTDGSWLHPFRPALFQPAVACRSLILPVYLRYLDASGQVTTLPAYVDDMSFASSLWTLLGARGLKLEIHFLPAYRVGEESRQQLACLMEEQIRSWQARLHPPCMASTLS